MGSKCRRTKNQIYYYSSLDKVVRDDFHDYLSPGISAAGSAGPLRITPPSPSASLQHKTSQIPRDHHQCDLDVEEVDGTLFEVCQGAFEGADYAPLEEIEGVQV